MTGCICRMTGWRRLTANALHQSGEHAGLQSEEARPVGASDSNIVTFMTLSISLYVQRVLAGPSGLLLLVRGVVA